MRKHKQEAENQVGTPKAKGPNILRIYLCNGSSMGTTQRAQQQDRKRHDIFVGVEHRLRREKLQDNFNKLCRKGYTVAADAARSTSEGQETTLHTSEGVFVADATHLASVVDAKGRKVEQLECNEGRVEEMWIKCREGIHILIVYLWHSEGWSVRNEALMSNWIISFDANMEPNDFAEGHWVKEATAKVKAPPEGSATYSAQGTGG